jgi:UDP-N-acetyl-alpha-D-muramoyl-L-alanyl-L-glutamate epimerase
MLESFDTFYIERFEFDRISLIARFYYSFDHRVEFVEEIDFRADGFSVRDDADDAIIETFLWHISIALGISYYKLSPTTHIVVMSGALDTDMEIFWNKFYTLGLGEFFYRNDIDPRGLALFSSDSAVTYQSHHISMSEKAIVPVGGGKDSIVTIERIRASRVPMDLFTFGKDNPIYADTARLSGQDRLIVKRTLSPNLFEMNHAGYYNGHVPITGVISFVLTLVAYLYDYRYIVFSNEQSSNFGNLEFHGMSVNHQYSKSLEFEDDFRQYTKRYMTSDIEYFSMMRPYYEINIITQFAIYQQYFGVFTSCNTNFTITRTHEKEGRWCRKCPKCAFVWVCLHPHITHEEIVSIFRGDMYEDTTLIPLFRELAGVDGHKPFECVGTNEEILWSMHESILRID